MVNICTGFGGTDSHALRLSDGRLNPSDNAGKPYQTITMEEVWAMLSDPPTVAKERAQWIIPSEYHQHDARTFEVQRDEGKFSSFLCWDVDKGNFELGFVIQTVRQSLGHGVAFVVYSSRGSKPDQKKWRVLVPHSQPLNGSGYIAVQQTFFEDLESLGLVLDSTLARPAQLVYLPNRGEHYEWYAEPGHLLGLRGHRLQGVFTAKLADQNARTQAQQSSKEIKGTLSWLGAFERKHPTHELLTLYGFEPQADGIHWISPLSASRSKSSFMLYEDGGWISLSDGDIAAKLGRPTPSGNRMGDGFDLFVHFNCHGNRDTGMAYAEECWREENRFWFEHGQEVYLGLERIGDKLGPAGQRQAVIESAKIVEEMKAEEPDLVDNENDWDIPWPPGVTGELAKYVYSASSRPVKQFAIGMALYIVSGMAGRQYNIEGMGLNLYMAIVGNSGTGKGEARRAAKRIYGAIGMAAHDPGGVSAVYNNDFPASAAGLRKMFDENNLAKAMYKEDADAILEMLTNTMPGGNGDLLRSAMSDYWDHAGEGNHTGAVSYAKKEDSTQSISSPSLTVGLDLQVDPFNRFLGHQVVMSTGFASRFLYLVRYGKRMHAQRNRRKDLPTGLVNHLAALWNSIRMQGQAVKHIGWAPGVEEDFHAFDYEMTERVNAGTPEQEIVIRAHINAARIAAGIAVMADQSNPVISQEMFDWAKLFVLKGYDECTKILATGEAGTGERVRVAKALKAITDYVQMPQGKRATYRVPKSLDTLDDVICETYMVERLFRVGDFKGSDTGLTSQDLVRRTIDELVRQEYLLATDRVQLAEQRNVIVKASTTQKLYLIGPAFTKSRKG